MEDERERMIDLESRVSISVDASTLSCRDCEWTVACHPDVAVRQMGDHVDAERTHTVSCVTTRVSVMDVRLRVGAGWGRPDAAYTEGPPDPVTGVRPLDLTFNLWDMERREWWRAEREGCTPNRDAAGLYTLEAAANIILNAALGGDLESAVVMVAAR